MLLSVLNGKIDEMKNKRHGRKSLELFKKLRENVRKPMDKRRDIIEKHRRKILTKIHGDTKHEDSEIFWSFQVPENFAARFENDHDKAIHAFLASQETEEGAILDSGSKAISSKVKTDFEAINFKEKVGIRGIGGVKSAYWGILKSCRLGNKIRALYCPELPVRRLFSTQAANELGWTVTLAPGVKTLSSSEGDLISLATSDGGLPYLTDLEFVSNDEIYALITKLAQELEKETATPEEDLDSEFDGLDDLDPFDDYCEEIPMDDMATKDAQNIQNDMTIKDAQHIDNDAAINNAQPRPETNTTTKGGQRSVTFGSVQIFPIQQTTYAPAYGGASGWRGSRDSLREKLHGIKDFSDSGAHGERSDKLSESMHVTRQLFKPCSDVARMPPRSCMKNSAVSPTEDDQLPSFRDAIKIGPSSEGSERKKLTKRERFLLHCRRGHFSDKSLGDVGCTACALAKSKKSSHQKKRPDKYRHGALVLMACDFFGPLVPSYRHNRYAFCFTCDECKYCVLKPVDGKHRAPEVLEEVCKEIRDKCGCQHSPTSLVFKGIRSDNEPALKSKRWVDVCERMGITETHSVPWHPQGNGTTERLIGSLKSNLTAVMVGVDPRAWCFALEFLQECYNERAKPGGLSPADIVRTLSTNPIFKMRTKNRLEKYSRRFGCLVYAKLNPKPTGALSQKRFAGMNLGFSVKSSSWLIGRMVDGQFRTYESRDAVFREDILTSDLVKLETEFHESLDGIKNSQKTVAKCSILEDESVATESHEKLVQPDAGRESSPSLVPSSESDVRRDSLPVVGETVKTQQDRITEAIRDHLKASEGSAGDANGTKTTELKRQRDSSPVTTGPQTKKLTPEHHTDKSSNTSTKLVPDKTGLVIGPTVRGRGRPKGSKDSYKRERKKKNKSQPLDVAVETFLTELEESNATNNQNNIWHFDEDEELIDEEGFTFVDMFLSNAEATDDVDLDDGGARKVTARVAMDQTNPEYPQWLQADDKERLKLLSYQCWRKLSKEEENDWRTGKLKAVPTMVIYTVKRSGAYKARCVVLGDRWSPKGDSELYAGNVSQASNRMMLVEAASKRMHVTPYDVGNAFINAHIPESLGKIAVLLPKHWAEDDLDCRVRILRRAMYGLPVSPRIWQHCYAKTLRRLGFEEAVSHTGVWIWKDDKGNVKHFLSVYVDDCTLCSLSKTDADEMLKQLHEAHPLSKIDAVESKDDRGNLVLTWDILGCDVSYCQTTGELRFNMRKYLPKVLKEFKCENIKPRDTPAFDSHTLYDDKQDKTDFPLRKLVGSLQWAQVCARPDLTQSVNTLARVTHLPTTKATVAAAKCVLRYVRGSLDTGIGYSFDEEQNFEKLYSALSQHPENAGKTTKLDEPFHAVQSFADASFASTVEMKSVTGAIVFYRGCPVSWRSSVQTLMSGSTSDCEWIAQSDCLLMSKEANSLHRFLIGKNEMEEKPELFGPLWCDNRSCVIGMRKEHLSDVPRKSRHMAIRMAVLRQEQQRILFTPTTMQRSDGLTKGSPNPDVYSMLFSTKSMQKWEPNQAQPVADCEAYAVTPVARISGSRITKQNNKVYECHLGLLL